MRPVVFALLLAACGSPPPVKSAPDPHLGAAKTEPKPAQSAPVQTVDDVALRFARAAASGDRATALALALTYDELVDISNNAKTRDRYEEALDDVLKQMSQKTEKGNSVEVTGVNVLKSLELGPPHDNHLKHAISAALVEFQLSRDGEAGKTHPWVFLKTTAGWKFSPVK